MSAKGYNTPEIQRFLKTLSGVAPDVVYSRDKLLLCDLFDIKTGTLHLEILDCSGLEYNVLNDFDVVQHLEGSLIIGSSNITDIDNFNSLVSVKSLHIDTMKMLERISGFNALEKIDVLKIHANPKLECIYGFSVLFDKNDTIKGSLKVMNNPKLSSIAFLKGLRNVGSSLYLHHNSLETLEGLESLEVVNASLSLSSNRLKTLKALSRLQSINGMLGVAYNDLRSLDGLENLTQVKVIKWNDNYRSIIIQANKNLQDISALSNVKALKGHMIIYVDSDHDYIKKPTSDSVFYQNSFDIYNAADQRLEDKTHIFDLDDSMEKSKRVKVLFASKWKKTISELDWIDPYFMDFKEIDKIISYCKTRGIKIIFPQVVSTQNFVRKHQKQLEKYDIKFILNSKRMLDTFINKRKFYDFMVHNAMNKYVPRVFENMDTIEFPAIVKAETGSSGRNMEIVRDAEELENVKTEGIVCEYIPDNVEYASNILFKNNKIVHAVTYRKTHDSRYYIQNAGNHVDVEKVDTPFKNIFFDILSAVNDVNTYSFCCIDYKIVDDKPKIFEINARLGFTLWTHPSDLKRFLDIYIEELIDSDRKPRILFGDKWQKATAKCDWMHAYHMHFDDVEKIISYTNTQNIQVLFGNNYTTQKVILNNADALRTKGLKFIVNSRRTLNRLVDKQIFYNIMVESGFSENVPVYYTSRSEIVYPCMVKPYSGGAGRGVYIANTYDEIIESNKQMIISEYLTGNTEYASSIFYKDGSIIHHKTYSKRVNKTHFVLQHESEKSIQTTAVETPFVELFRNIVEAFHGKEGYCLCSMNYKIVDGVLKLFEINPRTGYTLAQHTDDFKTMMEIYLDEVKKDSDNVPKLKPFSYAELRENAQIYRETADSKESFTHILVYQNWRFFYTLKGERAPLNAVDSTQSGIPDYIEVMLYKFETARRLLIKSFGLRDPLKGGFFYGKGAKFIDIHIKNIPKEHGIASGVVYNEQFDSLKDTPYQGKSLKITIHRNLIRKTATPIHELFHLFQYSYTHFNNMWFMEGLARWSQSIMQEKRGKEETLPQNESELNTLVHKLHDAEFFWNRLVTLCEEKDTFIIPKDLNNNSEIYNNKKTGAAFMKVFLEQCEIQYKLMEKSLKSRGINNVNYWARHEKRTANNNQYIFKAIVNTIDLTTKVKNEELTNFRELIRPLADIRVEDYNTQEIQSFLKVIKKYAKGFVLESDTGVLYSEFFDLFTGTFSCKEIDFTDSEISDNELNRFKVLKRIHGTLILKDCKNLTHLNGLENLISIERDCILSGLDLKDVNGLNTLTSVYQLHIVSMDKLESISGLKSLERIKSKLFISNCLKLSSISGFKELVDVGNIEITKTNLAECHFLRNVFKYHNSFNGSIKMTYNALEDISCMQGIIEVKSSFFLHKNALQTLEGLEELKYIGGSLSLSSNRLNDLRALRNLESINGILSLSYNDLVTLDGLENLKSLVTKKWSNDYFTIKLYGNSALKDISALSGIMTKDHYMVIYFDDINYLKKPDVKSDFHRNILELHDFKTGKLIPTYKFVSKNEHNYENFSKATHNKLLNTLFDFEIENADVLVLSFTGAYGNLGGLFYNKYALIIDNINTHKIFMMDPSHTWYNKGVPPFTKNMDENIQFIKELILSKKYKKVVCMGASMGAYISLLLGCVLEDMVDEVLVFSPQIFLDDVNRKKYQDNRWISLLKEFPKGMKAEYWDLKILFDKYQNHTTRFTIHYSSKYLVDYHHVHHLNAQDNITLVPYDVEDHYITVMLHKQDRLKPVILDVLRRE